MLKECLLELGHHLLELEMDPSIPPDPPEAEFTIYARKREAPKANLYYKEMHMQGLFTIDHLGWGGDHSGLLTAPDLNSTDPVASQAFCGKLRERFLLSGSSKHRQPPIRPIASEIKPYMLAPLQLPTDDAVVYQSSVSVVEYVHALADWAERRGCNVVFKLHPGSADPATEDVIRRRLGAHVLLLDENIHALIDQSEAVAVISSGVGFESLIHGKPVIAFGDCDYRWAGFRAKPSGLDEAWKFAQRFSEEDRSLAHRFVYYYYHRHAYLTTREAVPETKTRLLNYLRRQVGQVDLNMLKNSPADI